MLKRSAVPLLFALAASGCVSVASLPDPRGALRPGQRLVVALYQSPGPWIVDATDSKAEAAAKVSPVGFLMQTVQDQHTLSVSKYLQQYMPRPHYGLEVNNELMKMLKARISSGTVQTDFEAGVVPAQIVDWNKAKDQLDWRYRYYAPDPSQPPPRDYARILTLDDALILDVNVSFGTSPTEDGRVLPQMSAASRVYRGDTSSLLWEHEDEVTDATSNATLTDFKVAPAELTARIEALAPRLGDAVAASFAQAFGLAPSTAAMSSGGLVRSTAATNGHAFGSSGGGLVPMAFFQNMPAASTAAPAGVAASTAAAAAQPAVVQSTATAQPAPAPSQPPAESSGTTSSPAVNGSSGTATTP